MLVVIPVFDRLTVLDAIGPYEVLHRLPDTTVVFAAHRAGPVRADSRMLTLEAEVGFADVPHPDIVVIPGGMGTRPLVHDEEILGWIREANRTSRYTTSVCTGSLLLAAAGLLDGVEATTHWAAMDLLRKLGAEPVPQRVVERGRIITAAGVSSGIDMALRLAALLSDDLTARAIQLFIEYDPQPPFDAGSVAKAGDAVLARAAELAAERDD